MKRIIITTTKGMIITCEIHPSIATREYETLVKQSLSQTYLKVIDEDGDVVNVKTEHIVTIVLEN